MEDWGNLILDPGNTKGHVYWILKTLLEKEMEHVAVEMADMAQGIPNLRREMKNL